MDDLFVLLTGGRPASGTWTVPPSQNAHGTPSINALRSAGRTAL